ncbi:hypothetical protein FCULG_00005658 [Fusarium culmorum]|uniref:Uncharacterized protein n=1 Tax=Fusarium culmorum TaxID=5516 RepID=A0A2T4GXY8_FUSCU|nr:hypothetical protein FCULG_00005658 [Fusarium culmorum]
MATSRRPFYANKKSRSLDKQTETTRYDGRNTNQAKLGASFSERMSKLKRIFHSSKSVDKRDALSSASSSAFLPRRSLSITQNKEANGNQEEQLDYHSFDDEPDSLSHAMQQHIIKTRQSTPAFQKPGKHDEESQNHTVRDFQLRPFTNVGSISEEDPLLQRRLTDPDGTITNFKKLYEDLKHQLRDKSDEVRQLQEDNEILKRQCSEAATKTYNPQLQLPLTRPESELIKDWHTLAYNVNNFVENHFRDVNHRTVASWAKIQQEYLREVTERPQDIVTSRESGLALIKATVWQALKTFAFGGIASEGAMCWAGRYKGDLRKLGEQLPRVIYLGNELISFEQPPDCRLTNWSRALSL